MSYYKVGLHNVGSYQVSGKPYVSGGLDATAAISLSFPMVSRWVQVHNSGSANLKLGFSARGVHASGGNSGENYILVKQNTTLGPLELKLTEIHLSGGVAGGVSILAGLTGVGTDSIDNSSASPSSPYINWSGSAGVG